MITCKWLEIIIYIICTYILLMNKKINTYNAKIAVRSKGKFCVHIPKKLIDEKIFKLGDKVQITVLPLEASTQCSS